MIHCEICREQHDEERGLSFDGVGVNGCDKYRSRIATFVSEAPKHLGPLFALSPELLDALQDAKNFIESSDRDPDDDADHQGQTVARLEKLIRKVQVIRAHYR